MPSLFCWGVCRGMQLININMSSVLVYGHCDGVFLAKYGDGFAAVSNDKDKKCALTIFVMLC